MKQVPESDAPRTVDQGVANSNTMRSSFVMFTGTLVSRVLGFVRQWLLVLAIGGFGVADAFNTANTLPNTLYNLVAGGVLNAILVPWIVRALLRNKAGDQQGTRQVNALLTLASLMLLGLTLLTVALAYPLVLLFSSQISQDLLPLTVIFALWCLPQIFFYGLYALWGQVLNSLSNFGPYMWAPVLNNVVGIVGLSFFVYLYGVAPPQDHNVAAWDGTRIALLAGSMTLGIALQALVLILALHNCGFSLRPVFHFRGLGLRRTSKVAGWAFASLLLTTITNLVITNVGAAANGWGISNNTFVVSTAIYGYSAMLYMLPQSLITTSITTAIFTKMAYRATHGDLPGLSADYSLAMRLSGMFTVGLSVLMIVAALPLTQLTASNLPPEQAQAMALLLSIMCLGIPFQGIYATNSRVFYALENTRSQFMVTIPLMVLPVSAALLGIFFAPTAYWIYICVFGEVTGLLCGAIFGIFVLHQRGIPTKIYSECLVSFLRFNFAAIPSGALTWFTLSFFHTDLSSTWSVGSQLRAGLYNCIIAGLVMSVSYFAILWAIKTPEVRSAGAIVARKFGFLRKGTDRIDNSFPSTPQVIPSATQATQTKQESTVILPPSFQPASNRRGKEDPNNAEPTDHKDLSRADSPSTDDQEISHQEIEDLNLSFPLNRIDKNTDEPSVDSDLSDISVDSLPDLVDIPTDNLGTHSPIKLNLDDPDNLIDIIDLQPFEDNPEEDSTEDSTEDSKEKTSAEEILLPEDNTQEYTAEEDAQDDQVELTDPSINNEMPASKRTAIAQALARRIKVVKRMTALSASIKPQGEAHEADPGGDIEIYTATDVDQEISKEVEDLSDTTENNTDQVDSNSAEAATNESDTEENNNHESAQAQDQQNQDTHNKDKKKEVIKNLIAGSKIFARKPKQKRLRSANPSAIPAQQLQQRQKETRILIGTFAIILGVFFLVSILVLSNGSLAKPRIKDQSINLTPTESPASVTPIAEPVPLELSGVRAENPQGDGYDHPELAANVVDGNPQTVWRTARLITSKQRPGRGYALIVSLPKATQVREIHVASPCQGGELQVQAPGTPLGQGEVLAQMPYSDQMKFVFEQPRELSEIILWTDTLPTAPGGANQIIISDLKVLG